MKTLKELLQKESPFLLIAGPCAIEGEEMAFEIAEKCIEIAKKHSVQYVFKGSFKKANRSKIDSFTGIGDLKALNIEYLYSGGHATYKLGVITFCSHKYFITEYFNTEQI